MRAMRASGPLLGGLLIASCLVALCSAQSAPIQVAGLPGCGLANADGTLAPSLDGCVLSGAIGVNETVGFGFNIPEDVKYSLLLTLRVVGSQAQL
jgi:hypothetical protein